MREFNATVIGSVLRNIESHGLSTVLDVGANVGQFGIDLRINGYKGQIISFEPVTENFERLKLISRKFGNWETIQTGIGSQERNGTISVSGNSGLSSSFLRISETHLQEFPESYTKRTELAKIQTLDKQISLLKIDPTKTFLKIDTQGFEREVLEGASQALPFIPLCLLESSLEPLYEGESSILQLLNQLSFFGHEVVDIFRGTVSSNGKLLQVDILTCNTRI
jgi:FkbM family methyltransferase